MEEIGIDISGRKPKGVGTYLGKQAIAIIITVCSKAEESCPRIWPGLSQNNRLYWPFADPAEAEGTEEEKMVLFRQVRDQLREKIVDWLNSREI
jgi:arsenate reductase